LDACNHPHPFGMAADAVGNLFIAFSPSSGTAPLQPTSPTLLVSYSRDGLLRWKRTENMVGGEMAVAQGVLYPENSRTGLLTDSGARVNFGPGASPFFGRVVSNGAHVITSPLQAEGLWESYSPASGEREWVY